MKPTFHQWCTAAAVAILVLGALWILGQLYPATAQTQSTEFLSTAEYEVQDCSESPTLEQECREIAENSGLNEVDEGTLIELVDEGEQPTSNPKELNGNSNATLPATGSQRPVPPRIVSVSVQDNVPGLRRRESLHPHRRRRSTQANRPEVHHLVARTH